jgi:hypothetical protein
VPAANQQRLFITVTAFIAGAASAQCIGQNLTRAGIIFHNASATASIAITPVSFGSAALNTAGSITIGPLGSISITDIRSLDAFNAIASGSGVPLTIWEF